MGANDPPCKRIIIEQDGDGWVIGDDEGEFARCTAIADALHYASDLMHGPGTGPRGFVWKLLRDMEDVPECVSPSASVNSPFGV